MDQDDRSRLLPSSTWTFYPSVKVRHTDTVCTCTNILVLL